MTGQIDAYEGQLRFGRPRSIEWQCGMCRGWFHPLDIHTHPVGDRMCRNPSHLRCQRCRPLVTLRR